MSTRQTRGQKKAEEDKKNGVDSKPKQTKDDSESEEDEPKAKRAPRGAAAKKAAEKKKEKEEQQQKNNKKDDDEDEKDKDTKTKKASKAAKSVDTKDDKKPDDKKDTKADDPDTSKKQNTGDDAADTSNIKKEIIEGAAPVDEHCPRKDVEVYYTKNKIYSAKLNQANMSNNNNKFYIIQVLKVKGKDQYYHYNRWGRVGVPGQNSCRGPFTAEQACQEYENKLKDKTKKGEYRVLDMDYGQDATLDELDDVMKKDAETCKLPKEVISLISLIFDMKMINNQMKEIGYDVKKMPLGKLSKENINKAYGMLKQLYEEVEKPKKNKDKIEELCNEFYSYIPHDFGFKKMASFILDDAKKVKEKLEMIESIQNIQIATKLIEDKKQGKDGQQINQIQSNYEKLKCKIEPVKDQKVRKIIEDYLKNTHASTHNQYGLTIDEIFEVEREGENDRYLKDIKNKMLLWHGSRLTNFVGILSQGLRIAPPEAPVTGYMFGKGVYFADMCSKSANYCFTNKANNTGLMLLCEVALGEMNDKYYADYYASNLPAGKHSTRGRGKTAPPESSYVTIYDDVQVPVGKGEPQVFPNGQYGSLLYNEFIVYDIRQIKVKYLLRLTFNYKY
ncbi:poly(ADP-ribose) polymerase family WGR domain protein (macronuclear) [Tetrahymena thermophila SB210]|uniref:Poly [ADP-ribose] polymerase n=1 Tax=Tetrahymena thermophila (strain SB210) TaxID=312017 RepID=Q24GE4_TETTS|nr:poly(ADP-ribose) polymerase family WGR domain protein [Tetrahymena thermophila SB210]EAS06927.3 poly(ADP-ribose) polymerase family WGR domain protein [Tetrahymena thermophila SB210]|eukprot:XP_001027169.3 poly(ADP-ribose) polymerase family WGR domain protein [Tetrahymena thermophila SB210]